MYISVFMVLNSNNSVSFGFVLCVSVLMMFVFGGVCDCVLVYMNGS